MQGHRLKEYNCCKRVPIERQSRTTSRHLQQEQHEQPMNNQLVVGLPSDWTRVTISSAFSPKAPALHQRSSGGNSPRRFAVLKSRFGYNRLVAALQLRGSQRELEVLKEKI
jgi:hypothetical protein